MIDFSVVTGAAFWFYESRPVKLNGQTKFGRVRDFHSSITVDHVSATDRQVEAFIEPGDGGFVVEGELLSEFISLANDACEAGYKAGGTECNFTFAELGHCSIDLWEKRSEGRIAVRTTTLPRELVDQRSRLIQELNFALQILRPNLG